MPIYEYRCQKCGQLFQKLQSVSAGAKAVACPGCGRKRVERRPSVFASTSSAGSPGSSSSCAPGGG